MAKRWTLETDPEVRELRFARHVAFTAQMKAWEQRDRAAWDAARAETARLDDALAEYLPPLG